MNDTSPAIQRRIEEYWRSRPGAERVAKACSMFDDVKAIAMAGLKAQYPEARANELRRMLFARLYANDFAPNRLDKILRAL